MGIIATVIGILSTSADNKAETHKTTKAVNNKFSSANPIIYSDNSRKIPADSNQPTRTKSARKNTKTDNSTFLNIDLGSLCGETHVSKTAAPIIAIADGGKSNIPWKKNQKTTQPNIIKDLRKIIFDCKHLEASIFIKALNHFCGWFHCFLYINRIYDKTKIHETNTTGSEYCKKLLKLNPAADHIIIFGGSQTRVQTPAIFDKIANDNNNGIGLIFSKRVITNKTGTIKIMVVTLSKIIDNQDANAESAITKNHKFHCVFCATLIAVNWKNHVFSISATIIIIQNNSKIVLKSIDSNTWWYS